MQQHENYNNNAHPAIGGLSTSSSLHNETIINANATSVDSMGGLHHHHHHGHGSSNNNMVNNNTLYTRTTAHRRGVSSSVASTTSFAVSPSAAAGGGGGGNGAALHLMSSSPPMIGSGGLSSPSTPQRDSSNIHNFPSAVANSTFSSGGGAFAVSPTSGSNNNNNNNSHHHPSSLLGALPSTAIVPSQQQQLLGGGSTRKPPALGAMGGGSSGGRPPLHPSTPAGRSNSANNSNANNKRRQFVLLVLAFFIVLFLLSTTSTINSGGERSSGHHREEDSGGGGARLMANKRLSNSIKLPISNSDGSHHAASSTPAAGGDSDREKGLQPLPPPTHANMQDPIEHNLIAVQPTLPSEEEEANKEKPTTTVVSKGEGETAAEAATTTAMMKMVVVPDSYSIDNARLVIADYASYFGGGHNNSGSGTAMADSHNNGNTIPNEHATVAIDPQWIADVNTVTSSLRAKGTGILKQIVRDLLKPLIATTTAEIQKKDDDDDDVKKKNNNGASSLSSSSSSLALDLRDLQSMVTNELCTAREESLEADLTYPLSDCGLLQSEFGMCHAFAPSSSSSSSSPSTKKRNYIDDENDAFFGESLAASAILTSPANENDEAIIKKSGRRIGKLKYSGNSDNTSRTFKDLDKIATPFAQGYITIPSLQDPIAVAAAMIDEYRRIERGDDVEWPLAGTFASIDGEFEDDEEEEGYSSSSSSGKSPTPFRKRPFTVDVVYTEVDFSEPTFQSERFTFKDSMKPPTPRATELARRTERQRSLDHRVGAERAAHILPFVWAHLEPSVDYNVTRDLQRRYDAATAALAKKGLLLPSSSAGDGDAAEKRDNDGDDATTSPPPQPSVEHNASFALQHLPRALYAHARSTSDEANRFRNFNELRYSLRAIHRHIIEPMERFVAAENAKIDAENNQQKGASNDEGEQQLKKEKKRNLTKRKSRMSFGKIYIIVSHKAQMPLWMQAHDRIALVEQRDLYPNPSKSLPNFNSYSIESVMHRIPNLSRHYIYLNNDFIIARQVSFFDYFQPYVVYPNNNINKNQNEKKDEDSSNSDQQQQRRQVGTEAVVKWLPKMHSCEINMAEMFGKNPRWMWVLAPKEVATVLDVGKMINGLPLGYAISFSHIPQMYDKLQIMRIFSEPSIRAKVCHTRGGRERKESNIPIMHAYQHFTLLWRQGWGPESGRRTIRDVLGTEVLRNKYPSNRSHIPLTPFIDSHGRERVILWEYLSGVAEAVLPDYDIAATDVLALAKQSSDAAVEGARVDDASAQMNSNAMISAMQKRGWGTMKIVNGSAVPLHNAPAETDGATAAALVTMKVPRGHHHPGGGGEDIQVPLPSYLQQAQQQMTADSSSASVSRRLPIGHLRVLSVIAPLVLGVNSILKKGVTNTIMMPGPTTRLLDMMMGTDVTVASDDDTADGNGNNNKKKNDNIIMSIAPVVVEPATVLMGPLQPPSFGPKYYDHWLLDMCRATRDPLVTLKRSRLAFFGMGQRSSVLIDHLAIFKRWKSSNSVLFLTENDDMPSGSRDARRPRRPNTISSGGEIEQKSMAAATGQSGGGGRNGFGAMPQFLISQICSTFEREFWEMAVTKSLSMALVSANYHKKAIISGPKASPSNEEAGGGEGRGGKDSSDEDEIDDVPLPAKMVDGAAAPPDVKHLSVRRTTVTSGYFPTTVDNTDAAIEAVFGGAMSDHIRTYDVYVMKKKITARAFRDPTPLQADIGRRIADRIEAACNVEEALVTVEAVEAAAGIAPQNSNAVGEGGSSSSSTQMCPTGNRFRGDANVVRLRAEQVATFKHSYSVAPKGPPPVDKGQATRNPAMDFDIYEVDAKEGGKKGTDAAEKDNDDHSSSSSSQRRSKKKTRSRFRHDCDAPQFAVGPQQVPPSADVHGVDLFLDIIRTAAGECDTEAAAPRSSTSLPLHASDESGKKQKTITVPGWEIDGC